MNIIALVYGVFMIFNLAWPRQGATWLDTWMTVLSLCVVVVAGAIVYFIQRARGVDLSATIHEIELPGPDRDAAEALAAGMAGKVISARLGVSEMSSSDGPGKGGVTLD